MALLSACSSGGYAFSSSGAHNIDRIVFTNGSGQTNDFFVAPLGSTPLQVNAVAYKGSGQFSNVVPDATFTWSAAFAPAGTTYSKGGSPSGAGECGAPAAIIPQYYTILTQATVPGPPVPEPSGGVAIPPSGGDASPQYSGYNLLPSSQSATTVYVGPPLDPTKIPAVVPEGFATGSTSYCLFLVATHVGDGVQGSVTVVVSNSP
jgi:hypothetical protein